MKAFKLFILLLSSLSTTAQTLDSISMNPGYSHQSYYDFETGEVLTIDQSNWDLAFDASGFGAAIRINDIKFSIFLYPGDTSDFSTLDTLGMTTWEQLVNSDTDWYIGALNQPAAGAAEDMGWGEYNSITHHIVGNRIFLLEDNVSGEITKLWIKNLASGTYNFTYSNLDNTSSFSSSLTKSDFASRNFGYFNLTSNSSVDQEPSNEEWDIVFTKYTTELAPGVFYGVTGVLSNIYSPTQALSGVPVNSATYTSGTFSNEINTIGYNWKTFDMGTFSYLMEDSLCYFVETFEGNVWKIWFTKFEGSATGKVVFNKQLMTSVGTEDYLANTIGVFPNPANNMVQITSEETAIIKVDIFTIAGQKIETISGNKNNQLTVATSDFENGMYLVLIHTNDGSVLTKKIQVTH